MDTSSVNQAGVKMQLKQIGDQIEAIAKQLKGQGNQEKIDELYELGDRIEHFAEELELGKQGSGVVSGSDGNLSQDNIANFANNKEQDQDVNVNQGRTLQ